MSFSNFFIFIFIFYFFLATAVYLGSFCGVGLGVNGFGVVFLATAVYLGYFFWGG